MNIKGYVDNLIYQNKDNFYSVLSLVTEDFDEGEIEDVNA